MRTGPRTESTWIPCARRAASHSCSRPRSADFDHSLAEERAFCENDRVAMLSARNGILLGLLGLAAVSRVGAEAPVLQDVVSGMPTAPIRATSPGGSSTHAARSSSTLRSSSMVPDVVSSLPVPVPPPDPERSKRFLAPATDPAGAKARTIAQRVRSFRKFRSEVPGATWSVNPGQVWSIRREDRCLSALDKAKIEYLPVSRELTTPVATMVQLGTAPIAGVSFISAHLDRQIEVSCELAARLPELAKILRAHGVRTALVNSSYREQPRTSFHTFGLALDIAAFETRRELLVVAKHFEITPDAYTCEAQPSTPEGKTLLAIACDLAGSQLFSSVLTPNYNAGHRDHFHLDLRPDDPRFFVR